MLQKKVLLITYHFPPSAASGSFRLLGLAHHLPEAGWQPLVVAPPELPWEPVDPQLMQEVPCDAIVHPVPYPAAAPKLLHYFAGSMVWLPRAWLACRRMIQVFRPDVILTSGPPHCVHVLGHYLKRWAGVPWVADFRDPWISDGKSKKLSLMQRWALRWERRIFREADLVLANAPNACRLYQDVYPQQRDKIITLTNGFDPRPGTAPPQPQAQDSCLHLVHAGELYAGRDPLPLLEALASVNTLPTARQSFKLHVLGRSDASGVDYAQLLQARGWSDFVQLQGQQSYQETLRVLERAHILVLFDSPGRKIGVPAKLYEYFGAGRPILALAEPDGDVAAILRASGVLHRIASPTNTMQIQQALRELCQQMRDEPTIMQSALLKQFTRAYLAQRLAEKLNALTGCASVTSIRVDRAQVCAENSRSPHAFACNRHASTTQETDW